MGHVLGKLGAANRTEAVARGRDLGLIGQCGPGAGFAGGVTSRIPERAGSPPAADT